MASGQPRDRWAAWLLDHRFGGDAAVRDRALAQLAVVRDRVLAGAAIRPGDTVLDVGCGDGLLGVGALPLVGDSGQVIFSDVSTDLLEACRSAVGGLGTRCEFVADGLPGLDRIDSGTVDVALTRSVLIYVADKRASFAALHRVLRPGGRLSIFEPINRFGHPEPAQFLFGLDVTGLEASAARVKDVYRRFEDEQGPMLDFDERDLLVFAEAAGFTDVHLDYHVDIDRQPVDLTWSAFLRFAPNPLVPPMADVLAEALDGAEREALADRLRTELARGSTRRRLATAYLTASRPAGPTDRTTDAAGA